jgi:hypothetical protein
MFNYMLRFSVGSLLMVIVATLSSCGEKPETAKFKLGVVDELNPALYGSVKFKDVKVSADNKRAYVLNEKGALFAVDLKDGVNGFHDKNNWKRLTLKDEKKDGTTAGQAKLDQYEPDPVMDRMIALTNNGLVVMTNLNNATHAKEIGAVA